jgi:hypothetical protein
MKALDELAHTVCTFKAAQSSGHGKRFSCIDRQQRFGSSHPIDSLTAGFGYLG